MRGSAGTGTASSALLTALPARTRGPLAARLSTGSWILYDLANTAFSLGVVTVFYPQLMEQLHGTEANTIVGLLNATAALLVLVLAPILGAISDQARGRLPFLVATTLVCVGATFLLGYEPWLTLAPVFVTAVVAFQCGLIFYDSLLPEVSTDSNRGRVGGLGVGIGYGGSLIAIIVGSLLLPSSPDPADFAVVFRALAAVFLVAALPAFLLVRERPRSGGGIGLRTVVDAFGQLRATARRARAYRGLPRFLLGRALYTDAANTLVVMVVLYAGSAGMPSAEARMVAVPSILSAIAGGVAWGILVDRIGPRRTLQLVLWLWAVILAMAMLVPVLGLPYELLWGVSVLIGVALGGTWAADRPLMARISPPRYYGQFFGLYSMVGRASAVVGPAMWAAVSAVFGTPAAVGVLLLAILVAIGILGPVDDKPREWAVEDLPAPAG